jgi:hypothetical protein
VAYKLSPPPATPAEYKPANQATLVLIENYQNPDLYEVESERLERDVAFTFAEHKVFPVVPAQQLRELKAANGSSFYKMDVPTVARKLGAKQVVYVELQQFAIDPPLASQSVRGKGVAVVKMVDAQTGRVLWPRDSSAGREVKYETSIVGDAGGRAGVQEKLYQHLSDQIAALFYDAPSDQVEGGEPKLAGS